MKLNRITLPRAKSVLLPAPSLIAEAFPRIDYADAFALTLPSSHNYTVETATQALFTISLPWVDALMKLRDILVRPLGLKTSADGLDTPVIESEAKTVSFEVLAQTPQEILMGEDDRHLDFRVSVRLDGPQNKQNVTVSTIVRYNNWLGRTYFIPVRYFHRLIVPAMMKNLIRRMQKNR